jgi:hypothetical protein
LLSPGAGTPTARTRRALPGRCAGQGRGRWPRHPARGSARTVHWGDQISQLDATTEAIDRTDNRAASPDMIGFLATPPTTAEAQRLFDEDVADLGYVMNVSRLWAYQPDTVAGLFNLVRQANSAN